MTAPSLASNRIGLNPNRRHFEAGESAKRAGRPRVAPTHLSETQREDWLLGWDAVNTQEDGE